MTMLPIDHRIGYLVYYKNKYITFITDEELVFAFVVTFDATLTKELVLEKVGYNMVTHRAR